MLNIFAMPTHSAGYESVHFESHYTTNNGLTGAVRGPLHILMTHKAALKLRYFGKQTEIELRKL